jgi:hypothetical protein
MPRQEIRSKTGQHADRQDCGNENRDATRSLVNGSSL